MAETANIIVDVEDNSGGAFSTIESKMKNLGDQAKKVGAAMTAIGGAITGAAALAVAAAQEQETAEARLAQIATQVTGATEDQIQAMKDYAASLQEVGVVGDEVLIAGQSQLASFADSSDTVMQLSDDLADLAVAQYGVNVSQDQAISTANLLGKALGGKLGALTLAGIKLSEEQEAAFHAAGNEMERAAVLSEVIQSNYGGLNAAMLETSAGGLQSLKNQFGDMAEKVGFILIPIVTDLATKVGEVMTKIIAWTEENPKLTENIVKITAAVGALFLILGPIIVTIGVLVAAFNPVTAVIIAVIAAIGLLVAAFIYLKNNWEDVIKFFLDKIPFFGDFLVENFDEIAALVTEIWTILMDFFKQAWEQWSALFQLGLQAINILWTNTWNAVKAFIMTTWSNIKAFISDSLDALITLVVDFTAPIMEAFSNMWTGITDVISSGVDLLKDLVKGAINYIIETVNKAIAGLNKLASAASSIPGVNIPAIPEIPMLAEGGIVTSPTLAMIGEGAGPEAVIPLSKMGQFGMGGGNTFIFRGPVSSKEVAMEYADLITREFGFSNKMV